MREKTTSNRERWREEIYINLKKQNAHKNPKHALFAIARTQKTDFWAGCYNYCEHTHSLTRTHTHRHSMSSLSFHLFIHSLTHPKFDSVSVTFSFLAARPPRRFSLSLSLHTLCSVYYNGKLLYCIKLCERMWVCICCTGNSSGIAWTNWSRKVWNKWY